MQGAATTSIFLDRRGAATQQMAPRRRNPSGAGGLRAQASFRLVDDTEHRLLGAPCLRTARPLRAART
jgi:hypothetical protein